MAASADPQSKDHVDGVKHVSEPVAADPGRIPVTPSSNFVAECASAPLVPPGATVVEPDDHPSSVLNPRSCLTCRRRKVRCDTRMPCGKCRKAHIPCIFPAPGRAPRRPRPKDVDATPEQTSEREVELLNRLRELEDIVQTMRGQVERRHPVGADPAHGHGGGLGVGRIYDQAASVVQSSEPEAGSMLRAMSGSSQGAQASPTSEVNREFGKLVLNDKWKTRPVSNPFWSKMNEELNQLRADTQCPTDGDTDEGGDGASPQPAARSYEGQHADHHAFVFGHRLCGVELRKLHPLPSQIPFIWRVYTESVDPLVKILHLPSMDKVVRELRSDMSNLSSGLEALMFAVYYAATTSMEENEVGCPFGEQSRTTDDDSQVMDNFRVEKQALTRQFRFGTEQALANANFLTTSELTVVQAFTLFLVVVRQLDPTRYSWTLSGLLFRISQSLGIHRDGSQFADLSLFDMEMRRRLWWVMCILDLRSAEDQGTELAIANSTFDTQYPLNVNDTDISPDMINVPGERDGPTDMTFCLIRFELCALARRLHISSGNMTASSAQLTGQNRKEMLLETHRRVEEKYLKPCADKDVNTRHFVAALHCKLIMAKMKLMALQPFNEADYVIPDPRDYLLLASVEVVEYNRLLHCDPRCKPYRWLFTTYTQWHAITMILLLICRRPWTANAERAWMTLSETFQQSEPDEFTKLAGHSAVWMPLRRLMIKAKRHREAEIERLSADPDLARELDGEEMRLRNAEACPTSMRSAAAHERWLKLVGMIPVPGGMEKHSYSQPAQETLKSPDMAVLLGDIDGLSNTSQILTAQQHVGSQRSCNRSDSPSGALTEAPAVPASELAVWQSIFGEVITPADDTHMADTNQHPLADDGGSMSGTPHGRRMRTALLQAPSARSEMDIREGTWASDTFTADNGDDWLWAETSVSTSQGVPNEMPGDDVPMDDDFNFTDWQPSFRDIEIDTELDIFGGGSFSAGL